MRVAAVLLVCSALTTFTGCAKLFGALRPDLDSEPPTVGGTWPERGLLDSEDEEPAYSSRGNYSYVGHSERGPASQGYQPTAGEEANETWVGKDESATARRDQAKVEDQTATSILAKAPRKRYTKEDFVDNAQGEGSLWASDGQTNHYFSKNKVHGLGDIIAITSDENMAKDLVSEIKKRLTLEEREREVAEAQIKAEAAAFMQPNDKDAAKNSVASQTQNVKSQGKVDDKVRTSMAATQQIAFKDLDLSQFVGFKAGDPFMGEVVERYPNGSYKIKAVKKVAYRDGHRWVTLIGVARSTDISEDDKVEGAKLYEYRMEVAR